MKQSTLDELIERARRDKPTSGQLQLLARRLQLGSLAAPLATALVPSTALAASTKLGLGRGLLWGLGTGSALAATGVAAAVALHEPEPPPVVTRHTAPVQPELRHSAAPSPLPEPLPNVASSAPSAERSPLRDTPTSWDEPRLVESARRALAGDPRRALALAQEHRRRFPAGALSMEREVIALEALARIGRSAEARQRALAFQARYPKSIHAPQVRALLARLGEP